MPVSTGMPYCHPLRPRLLLAVHLRLGQPAGGQARVPAVQGRVCTMPARCSAACRLLSAVCIAACLPLDCCAVQATLEHEFPLCAVHPPVQLQKGYNYRLGWCRCARQRGPQRRARERSNREGLVLGRENPGVRGLGLLSGWGSVSCKIAAWADGGWLVGGRGGDGPDKRELVMVRRRGTRRQGH